MRANDLKVQKKKRKSRGRDRREQEENNGAEKETEREEEEKLNYKRWIKEEERSRWGSKESSNGQRSKTIKYEAKKWQRKNKTNLNRM